MVYENMCNIVNTQPPNKVMLHSQNCAYANVLMWMYLAIVPMFPNRRGKHTPHSRLNNTYYTLGSLKCG